MSSTSDEPSNLLESLHSLILGLGPSREIGKVYKPLEHDDIPRIPSVVELRKKGSEVRALKKGSCGIRQIDFTNFNLAAFAFAPALFLPVLTVSENLEDILRNLIYYEMLQILPHGNEKFEVSSYLTLMSELISKPLDAKLLHDNGVVKGNLLQRQRLPKILKKLVQEFGAVSSENLLKVRLQIGEYYVPRWRKNLKYIPSLSQMMAAIGLTFTILGFFKH